MLKYKVKLSSMGGIDMVKKIVVFLIFACTIIMGNTVNIFADNEYDDTNNLNLDTEILNNKKEDYNSTTSIGDINLFSSDYKEELKKEDAATKKYYENITESVFTNEDNNNSEVKEIASVFKEEVTFDKMAIDSEDTFNYQVIILIMFAISMSLTFVLTRIKYKKRESENDEYAISSNFDD